MSKTVHLLDYVAGNIRSLVNAIEKIGYQVEWIKSPDDVPKAEKLILPGVGHFGHCLSQLAQAGYLPAIQQHIATGKPFFGVCVGLQALFRGSAEDPDVPGLGVVAASLDRFADADKPVPHIGWNDANTHGRAIYDLRADSKYYYVHSYKCPHNPGELEALGWTVATGTYGGETFVGAIAKGNIYATQFHPEKSGVAGLRTLRAFLTGTGAQSLGTPLTQTAAATSKSSQEGLTRRVIACLDVRTNDQGDLVVTKGDQYDVRDKADGNHVRNLGKPVDMARRYYEDGADEVTFLNITSFRDCPLADLPMLEVLRQASRTVFVPLTVGGGIRDTVDTDGTKVTALEIATMYFKSGADKVSIGSDAVIAAEEYYSLGRKLFGDTAIEQIARAYGNQAVVVSVDPKRVYVPKRDATRHALVETSQPGPRGEPYCWYACTIKGGRETRDMDVVELAQAVEAMGAGELLLNCIDRDGTNAGFDLELVAQVKAAVSIPVIASSGAGVPAHFDEVFRETTTDAALGAGMFHRGEYTVRQVKEYLDTRGLVVRKFEEDDDDGVLGSV
ncbi:imidazole glycerol phosphate synthase hisHF [Cordyceps fumosorosea ARSEF 2679]|uniref:Imidazole glycerol phosphate synthase hisHF n=1 Tax=Cordyceps fumosorosea (strain ARSEF 2679) TaxID=1081104 RepID=A0A167XCE2_CORFA|nr:imidazole glycerol phosphate synthase hisHF [Cordyceps fumosorosea ARSEF 2679]OAA64799.1 imidazole glycerol phosphate synthase hisHF [Cordyceps fumosorosea ARSEF 2679]